MTRPSDDEIRGAVRGVYGAIAERGSGGCAPGCCGPTGAEASLRLGYSEAELAAVPAGADLGLGCGNPQALAALRPGERVLDLGSGAGFDCLLAARQVGPTGSVIGVDMTAAMVSRARANVAQVGATNVDFRLGEIERLPVADASVDVILSNCVVNLSPDKRAVFQEAFRVLAPGGRLAIADVVALGPMPDALRSQLEALAGCVAGAAQVSDIEGMLREAGFDSIQVTVRPESRTFIRDWLPGSGAEDVVASASIEATKPLPVRSCCGPACCPADKASA